MSEPIEVLDIAAHDRLDVHSAVTEVLARTYLAPGEYYRVQMTIERAEEPHRRLDISQRKMGA